ncbi:hypothetical protein C8J57DRAFT_1479383 [Mycena rebaudengoi]|nr:hypothetical protein C8J57DRAFT_1479383 [Mycena rebaudengoi]
MCRSQCGTLRQLHYIAAEIANQTESIEGHKDVSASNPSLSMSLDTPVYVPRNISCPGALADELAAALCGNQANSAAIHAANSRTAAAAWHFAAAILRQSAAARRCDTAAHSECEIRAKFNHLAVTVSDPVGQNAHQTDSSRDILNIKSATSHKRKIHGTNIDTAGSPLDCYLCGEKAADSHGENEVQCEVCRVWSHIKCQDRVYPNTDWKDPEVHFTCMLCIIDREEIPENDYGHEPGDICMLPEAEDWYDFTQWFPAEVISFDASRSKREWELRWSRWIVWTNGTPEDLWLYRSARHWESIQSARYISINASSPLAKKRRYWIPPSSRSSRLQYPQIATLLAVMEASNDVIKSYLDYFSQRSESSLGGDVRSDKGGTVERMVMTTRAVHIGVKWESYGRCLFVATALVTKFEQRVGSERKRMIRGNSVFMESTWSRVQAQEKFG